MEIPTVREELVLEDKQKMIKLEINDLSSNIYFAAAHNEIMKSEMSLVKNGQMVGALQTTNLFSYGFKEFYLVGTEYYEIEADYDLSTKRIKILTSPKRVNLYEGFVPIQSNEKATVVLEWLQRTNAYLSKSLITEVGRKQALTGVVWKIVAKLPNKYVNIFIYGEGDNLKILKEIESGIEGPSVRPFPRPGTAPLMSKLNEW